MEPACTLALIAHFGSVVRWREALATGARAWAWAGEADHMQLVFLPGCGALVNRWLAEQRLAHGVSRATALRLRAAGLNVRFMQDGTRAGKRFAGRPRPKLTPHEKTARERPTGNPWCSGTASSSPPTPLPHPLDGALNRCP